MPLALNQAKAKIDAIFDGYRQAPAGPGASVLPAKLSAGKVYEAWVLAEVIAKLRAQEGYTAVLHGAASVRLKSSPGPINRAYAYLLLDNSSGQQLELWTDIEFVTLSYDLRRRAGGIVLPGRGDYHELDIVAVAPGTTGRPAHGDVVLGIECKATPYTKALLRAILGVRRELSLLLGVGQATRFTSWPSPTVRADPNSCLMTYSTDGGVNALDSAGEVFSIDFVHLGPP